MSKRLSVSHTDCPTKRKAKTITDFFQPKCSHPSLVPELTESNDMSSDDELKGLDDAEMSCTPSSDPNPMASMDSNSHGSASVFSGGLSLVDVGELVELLSTNEQLESAIHSLTDTEKYQYLTEHFKPCIS